MSETANAAGAAGAPAPATASAPPAPAPAPAPHAAASAATPTAASSVAESPAAHKTSSTKDRNCPYCGQAFTSSSLGRHLDLYIKEKNPKPPDGIHDVDAIRKMRESITRRQPRNSLARRDTSNPGTPNSSSRKSPGPDPVIRPPAIPKEGHYVVDHPTIRYPFQPSWEATGVINDIPTAAGDHESGSSRAWENPRARASPVREPSTRPRNPPRAPSRAAQKVQFDEKQRLADAIDTARAAELALRELLSSMRAAKQHVDMNSLPFDFEPLALDFPALTLQCLQAPPTLFSSTPHPTSTSWSIQPPGQKQYEALQMYFSDEFRKWRIACATATTISSEDLTYPPTETHYPRDMREGVKRAEKAAALLEKQLNEHLQSTYHVWEQLSSQRRSELWGLELARSVGRRQKELEKLKEVQYSTKQENANLKMQIEQLNRLQQPREFRIQAPATIPIEESFMNYLLSLGTSGVQGVGITMEERHVDLNTMVSRAIDRWKAVIVAGKGPGMGGQKSLDQAMPTTASIIASPVTLPPQGASRMQPHAPQRSLAVPAPLSTGSSTTTAAPSAGDEENSDEDADAEMDEDNFTSTVPAMAKVPAHIQSQLEVSRTRSHNNRVQNNADARFTANRNSDIHRRPGARRSVPNANSASLITSQRQPQGGHVNGDEHTTGGNQGALCGDPMYMD